MLAGETCYLLVTEYAGDYDRVEVRIFARQHDAVEAWRDTMREIMETDNLEGIDDFAEYDEGEYFLTPYGTECTIRIEEVE